ncbi:glutaredoxin domain-containing protein [Nocardioides sp.]|uniref:glutaredoxin domain-containing protein n=1 Tax=Nocardioides sp. TaxID=35761 RepID=UPI002B275504|nr:glutaredoxin domain-containing protein [Nocardioides sp.]
MASAHKRTGGAPAGAAGTARGSAPTIEVFWRPGCPFCQALRVGLRLRGVRATWRNIYEDPAAAKIVRAHNGGNETVPTVRIGTTVLSNPTAGTVRSHARALSRGGAS